MREARRCIQCTNSPALAQLDALLEVDIPEFIALIAEGKFDEAAAKIKEKNSLPAICGRVCPQESQCESLCTLGKKFEPVAIGALERFAADWASNRAAEVGRACGETCACAGDRHLSAECECASKACDLDSRGCAPHSDARLPELELAS